MRDAGFPCCNLRDEFREALINSKNFRCAVGFCAYGTPMAGPATRKPSPWQQCLACNCRPLFHHRLKRVGSLVGLTVASGKTLQVPHAKSLSGNGKFCRVARWQYNAAWCKFGLLIRHTPVAHVADLASTVECNGSTSASCAEDLPAMAALSF